MTFPKSLQLPGSILPAQGPDLAKVFYDDFSHFDVTATGKWVLTDTGGGTAIIGPDGFILTTEGDDDDSVGIQGACVAAGGAFALDNDKDIYGHVLLKMDDVDLCDWFVGIATLDSVVIDGTTDAVGLGSSTGSAITNSASASVFAIRGAAMGASWANGTFVDTGVDIVDDIFFDVAWWIQGRNRMTFYVNGKELVNVTSVDFPAAGARMTPTIEFQAQSGAARILTAQSYYCAQSMAA